MSATQHAGFGNQRYNNAVHLAAVLEGLSVFHGALQRRR